MNTLKVLVKLQHEVLTATAVLLEGQVFWDVTLSLGEWLLTLPRMAVPSKHCYLLPVDTW